MNNGHSERPEALTGRQQEKSQALDVADFEIDDILSTPGERLMAEVGEDFGDPTFLVAEFDAIARPLLSGARGGEAGPAAAAPAAAVAPPSPSVASSFRSMLDDYDHRKYSRLPVWLRTHKANEYPNKHFQDILGQECVPFQVWKDLEVKCLLVKRAHRSNHERLLKYFPYKYAFRYIDVLPKFVRDYKDAVNFKTGMVNTRVGDSEGLAI